MWNKLNIKNKKKSVLIARDGKAMASEQLKVPNTVRFLVPEERKEEVTRSYFVKKVLKEFLKLDGRSVVSVQDFVGRGFIDVTFPTQMAALGVIEKIKAAKDVEALRQLRYVANLEMVVIVHMFNPFVPEEDIMAFLNRYCLVVSRGKKLVDEDGFWTGKRQFVVGLRAVRGKDTLPPHSFALGPHRGYLFFPGREGTCWSCGVPGHSKEQCTKVVCRQCGSPGHFAKDCKAPRSCSLCREVGHLFRGCPYRRQEWKEPMEPASRVSAPVKLPDQEQRGTSREAEPVVMTVPGAFRRAGQLTAGGQVYRFGESECVSDFAGVRDERGGCEEAAAERMAGGASADSAAVAAVPPPPVPQEGRGGGETDVEPGGLLPGWGEVLQRAAEPEME